MSTSPFRIRVLQIIVGAAGLILFSQGMSFARWSEFKTQQESINDLANLLLLGGLGIFSVYLQNCQTSQIITELRNKLSEVEARIK